MTLTKVTAALSSCEQALDNLSDWMPACQDLANVLQGEGLFEASSEWFSLALEPEPNAEEIYAKLGRLYAEQESWTEAIAAFEQILALPGEHAGAYWHLAKIYEHLGQTEKELECRYQLFALRPEQASVDGYYQLGHKFIEERRPEEAITCYLHSIEQNDQFWTAYYELGDLFTAQGEWDHAIKIYQSLLERDPFQIKAHFKIGLVWVRQGNDEEAIAKFREIVSLNPEFPWAYLELVKILIRQERWEDAIATCDAVVEFVREFPWVYSHRGQALLQTGEITEAILCFQQACEHQGWSQCRERAYQFTRDAFSHQIPLWQEHLQALAVVNGAQVLEVGSFEGMTTCWLLDHLLINSEDQLTCIDVQFPPVFTENVEKTGAIERVICLEGNVHAHLEMLELETFDLINIQDRCKKAEHLYRDAVLAWKLLKVGGILLFKDYGWRGAEKKQDQSPKRGIDDFLRTVKGQHDRLHQGYQLIIQKVAA